MRPVVKQWSKSFGARCLSQKKETARSNRTVIYTKSDVREEILSFAAQHCERAKYGQQRRGRLGNHLEGVSLRTGLKEIRDMGA